MTKDFLGYYMRESRSLLSPMSRERAWWLDFDGGRLPFARHQFPPATIPHSVVEVSVHASGARLMAESHIEVD
jgi:hypothetical protein